MVFCQEYLFFLGLLIAATSTWTLSLNGLTGDLSMTARTIFFPIPSFVTCAALVLGSCSAQLGTSEHVGADHAEILVFGDSGYHFDYMEDKNYVDPALTHEEYLERRKVSWLQNRSSLDKFEMREIAFHEGIGGYVPASGLARVSDSMTSHCEFQRCDFAVMLGDNIYPDGATRGADGKDDEQRFNVLLAEPFRNLGVAVEDFLIYSTLGNHDWNTSREGALDQVEFLEMHKSFYMDGLFYRVVPPSTEGLVELFIIDTSMLLAAASEQIIEERIEAYRSAIPQTSDEKEMLDWLDNALGNSTAKWKIVLGHHPLWSIVGGRTSERISIRNQLQAILCRNADLYLAGHEHTLEVHEGSCARTQSDDQLAPLTQIISGAVAKQITAVPYDNEPRPSADIPDTLIWGKGLTYGFVHLSVHDESLTADFLTVANSGDATGRVEYTHVVPRRSRISK